MGLGDRLHIGMAAARRGPGLVQQPCEEMKIGEFTFNWFDLAVLIVIAVGLYRGRSRGMSLELLDVLKWLTIVVVGGLSYRPLGRYVADFTHITPVTAYVLSYLFVLVAVRFVFNWMKRMLGEKLISSDVFGNSEYYLGMMAGAVRFACVLMLGLALLNAIYVSPEQLAAQARMQQENFGDISFPTIGTVQQTVFVGSASGRFVKRYLGHELIVTDPSDRDAKPADTLGRQRERVLDEVMGPRK